MLNQLTSALESAKDLSASMIPDLNISKNLEEISTNTKTAIAASGAVALSAIGYVAKKRHDYRVNFEPPNDELKEAVENRKIYHCNNSGAIIEYNIFGNENGFPVLYLHGEYGCSLEAISFDKIGNINNLRIISISLIGCGNSKFPENVKKTKNYKWLQDIHREYSIKTYFSDIRELLEREKVDCKNGNFGIIGVSNGGPLAMRGLHYLNPKFIALFAGVPLVTQYEMIMDFKELNEENNIEPLYEIEPIMDSTSSKLRLKQKGMRLMVFYYQDKWKSALKSMAPVWPASPQTFDQIAYINLMSLENGISGMRYTLQTTLAGAHGPDGFNLYQVNWDKKLNTKIFMFNSGCDVVITPQWQQLYCDKLNKKYGFRNVELKEFEKESHYMSNDMINESCQIISKYINENIKIDTDDNDSSNANANANANANGNGNGNGDDDTVVTSVNNPAES